MRPQSFSVLLPIYNRPDLRNTFPKSIAAVCENTALPDQVVIICDGPLDWDIDDAISGFLEITEITVVKLATNVGLRRALNIGLSHCRNELIARVDADDYCRLDRFEKQLNYIAKGYTLVGSNVREVDEQGKFLANKIVPESAPEINSYALWRNPFNHMSVMFKKSHVLNVGGYPDFYLKEDYALWVRLLASSETRPYNIQHDLMIVTAGSGMYSRRSSLKILREEYRMQMFLRTHLKKELWKIIVDLLRRTLFYFTPIWFKAFAYEKLLRR